MISRTSVMEVVISGYGANIKLALTKDNVTFGDDRFIVSKAAALAVANEIAKYYHELEEASKGVLE